MAATDVWFLSRFDDESTVISFSKQRSLAGVRTYRGRSRGLHGLPTGTPTLENGVTNSCIPVASEA